MSTVTETPDNSAAQDKRTITLTFTDADSALYAQITQDAAADERAVSKYLLRYLKANYKSE